jgi:hypothetical protein
MTLPSQVNLWRVAREFAMKTVNVIALPSGLRMGNVGGAKLATLHSSDPMESTTLTSRMVRGHLRRRRQLLQDPTE